MELLHSPSSPRMQGRFDGLERQHQLHVDAFPHATYTNGGSTFFILNEIIHAQIAFH